MGLGLVRESLQLSVFVVGVIGLSIFVVSLSIQKQPAVQSSVEAYLLPKSVVCLYYGVIFCILILFVLPALGVIKASIWTVYGVLFYGVSSGVFMTVLLIVRSQKMERLRLEMSRNLLISQAELSAETLRRQDQSRLLSMLMHEIKTPLAVIDMAMRKRDHDNKNAGYVERAIDNMKDILDRCVQTDRMMDGKFELQIQTFNLTKQLMVWVCDRKEDASRFELLLQDDVHVSTDLQCLQIIVNNLIENAFKHGHATAPLVLTLKTSQGQSEKLGVQIEFSNLPGPSGWPSGEQLFDKYYRSSQAQRQSGTGLGLYLSHNLAFQLGGSLRYRTEEGRIIFDLWLPS
jgi:signal transduction histidine kinase